MEMRSRVKINLAVRATLGWASCILVLAVLASPAFGQSRSHRRQPTPAVGDRTLPGPLAVQPATANQLIAAMEIPQANVVSATLDTSDPGGVGVGTTRLGRFFPRQGSSFALLSTGLAASAEAPNDSDSTSTVLPGLDTSQGEDMVQLRIVLAPPPGAQCLGFDFAFFSEEFPEFVGSPFNDAFLAELGGSNFQIVGTTITAPRNFAVDPVGNLISINSVFGVSPNTQSTYDGATSALRAVAALNASAFPTVELVLTIADLGDSIYDSTVMLDNFAFSTTGCSTGAGLADMIISPQSGFITANETFDLTLLASQPVTSYTVGVNGIDISNFVAGCIRGTQSGGGSTVRCPGISGNLLASVLGPGPFVFDVTANFTNGSTRTETVAYDLIGSADIGAVPLAVLPASGPFASTQRFDLVVVVRPDVVGATVSVDGLDVTGIVLPCFLANVASIGGGAAYAARCPLVGGVLPPGPHVVVMTATFSGGEVASGSFILDVRANTEP
jgi:hypothetical protein